MTEKYLSGIVPPIQMQKDCLEHLSSMSEYGHKLSQAVQSGRYISLADIPFELDYDMHGGIRCGFPYDVMKNSSYPHKVFEGLHTGIRNTDEVWVSVIANLIACSGDLVYCLYGAAPEMDAFPHLEVLDTVFNDAGEGSRVAVPYIKITNVVDVLNFIDHYDGINNVIVISGQDRVFSPKGVFVNVFDRQGVIAFIDKELLKYQ